MHVGDDQPRNPATAFRSKLPLTASDRAARVRQAFVLEWITVAWMIIESIVAIAAALEARSTSLLAFGIDSLIELISASVLLWRLTVELKQGQVFSEQVERTASRIGGALLYALAIYVVLSAGLNLWQGRGQDFSTAGFALTLAAIPIMWWLARRKLTIATQLGSRALRTDAVESITCGYLSGAVVVGLIAQRLLNAWWVDSITSFAIVYFVVKEAREAWYGEDCCEDD
jgi:divalent metal cation (Fe/Co/Zn/Cd) transporter